MNKKGQTLLSTLIGIAIIGFVGVGISKIIMQMQHTNTEQESKNNADIEFDVPYNGDVYSFAYKASQYTVNNLHLFYVKKNGNEVGSTPFNITINNIPSYYLDIVNYMKRLGITNSMDIEPMTFNVTIKNN